MRIAQKTVIQQMDAAKRIKEFAAELGRLGGSDKSKAKAEAARKNGAKGGRPRKPKIDTSPPHTVAHFGNDPTPIPTVRLS